MNNIRMQVLGLATTILLILSGYGCESSQSKQQDPGITYPETRKVDSTDTYFGTEVSDPYRWLEDLDSEETADWVQKQNAVTMPYLQKLPGREQVKDKLTQWWDYPKYSAPQQEGDYYYYFYNDGLQDQSVMYRTDMLGEKGQVVLDPNTLSDDGTVALSTYKVSPNGRYLAYGISRSGSDWREFRVKDLRTGRDLRDELQWIKFSSMTWTSTSNGFYYARYPEPKNGDKLEAQNQRMQVYYHRVGSAQQSDQLIYEDPEHPDWGFYPQMTEDGNYLTLTVTQGTDERNRFYIRPMSGPNKGEVIKLLNDFDARYQYITNEGTRFYFKTNWQAPKYRVIAVDIDNPGKSNWVEVIPERNHVLQQVEPAGNQLALEYLEDVKSTLYVHDLETGEQQEIMLPGVGSVEALNGNTDSSQLFYSYSSFNRPSTIYLYDLETGETTLHREPTVAFDPEEYVTEQVFYESKDGTEIPMFISYKKSLMSDDLSFKEKLDLRKQGYYPTLLYGYGGFNISLTPRFSISNLVWMDMGGIYAVPNLRGGGEYGESWHKQGTKMQKQNVFDDFIAAAEYLIDNRYTSSKRLAISGGSNGGLLVGACMTQRPDLFKVALPAVGVLDMLRYHKFTIGWAWASDYGTSEESKEMFEYLNNYSPIHNVEEGVDYPATLITTADHDDRVVPSHSFKFTATLQEHDRSGDPILIRIEEKAGHGAGKPTAKIIEEQTDKLIFTGFHTKLLQ
ncbi:MAG: prolyl oligopeptidase family serine peptidase [Bacteroidota bacterium]